jgi:hypothetical protein
LGVAGIPVKKVSMPFSFSERKSCVGENVTEVRADQARNDGRGTCPSRDAEPSSRVIEEGPCFHVSHRNVRR